MHYLMKCSAFPAFLLQYIKIKTNTVNGHPASRTKPSLVFSFPLSFLPHSIRWYKITFATEARTQHN